MYQREVSTCNSVARTPHTPGTRSHRLPCTAGMVDEASKRRKRGLFRSRGTSDRAGSGFRQGSRRMSRGASRPDTHATARVDVLRDAAEDGLHLGEVLLLVPEL